MVTYLSVWWVRVQDKRSWYGSISMLHFCKEIKSWKKFVKLQYSFQNNAKPCQFDELFYCYFYIAIWLEKFRQITTIQSKVAQNQVNLTSYFAHLTKSLFEGMFGSRKTSKMDSYLFHASQDTRRLVKGLRCCSCLYVFCEKYEVRKRGKFGCCTWSKWYWCEWRWKWWRPSWWWWGWCSWRGWCRYSNARCKACPAYTLVDRKKTALPDKIS